MGLGVAQSADDSTERRVVGQMKYSDRAKFILCPDQNLGFFICGVLHVPMLKTQI